MKTQDDLISENDRLDTLNKKLQSHIVQSHIVQSHIVQSHIDTLRLENASFTKQIE
jgi:hypothetical protein